MRAWYVPEVARRRAPPAPRRTGAAPRRPGRRRRPAARRATARRRRLAGRRRRFGLLDRRRLGLAQDLAQAVLDRLGEGDAVLVDHDHAHELGEGRALGLEEDRLDVQQAVVADRQHQQVAADDDEPERSRRRTGRRSRRSGRSGPRSAPAPGWRCRSGSGTRCARRTTAGSMRAATQAIMLLAALGHHRLDEDELGRVLAGDAHGHVVRLHRLAGAGRRRRRGSPSGRPGCRRSWRPPSVAGRW